MAGRAKAKPRDMSGKYPSPCNAAGKDVWPSVTRAWDGRERSCSVQNLRTTAFAGGAVVRSLDTTRAVSDILASRRARKNRPGGARAFHIGFSGGAKIIYRERVR